MKSENSCEVMNIFVKTEVDYAQSIGRTSKTVDLGSLYSSDSIEDAFSQIKAAN